MIYTCNKCNKIFRAKSHFETHLNKKFACTKEKNIIQNEVFKPKNYECKYCLKLFSRTDTLKKHIDGYCKEKKDKDIQDEINPKPTPENEQNTGEIPDDVIVLMADNKNLLKEVINSGSNCNIMIGSNNNNTTNNNTNNNNIYNNIVKLITIGSENFDTIVTDEFCNKTIETYKYDMLCGGL